MSKLYIILASYNRAEKTLRCIDRIFEENVHGFEIQVILYDDNSSDGTATQVKNKFPSVTVINGTGDKYWCRSMCAAYDHLRNDLNADDYLICLNDDVALVPEGIQNLLMQQTSFSKEKNVVIAGTCSDSDGKLTYGGLKRTGKIKFELIVNPCQMSDTMNFNVVLIPGGVLIKYGFLDPVFEHSMGDIEYGLRLSKYGVRIYTSSDVVGCCEANDMLTHFHNKNILERLKICLSKKYFPVKSWLHFTRAISGALWPFYFIYPYIKFTMFYKSDGH